MPTVPMNLLFDDIEVIESMGDPASVLVGGIAHDSRRVRPGDLFCCVPGIESDGHAFALDAVDRGAVGLLCEHFIPELNNRTVVQTRVAPGTMRSAMARLAAAFYEFPSRDLLMVGVTGTNGKTTVTQILGDLLAATGIPDRCHGNTLGCAHDSRGHGVAACPGRGSRSPAGRRAAPRRGHGGVEPRAGAVAGGGHPLRRGRLHQSESRPPRLPPHHGGVLRSQGESLLPQSRPAGRDQRR